MQLQRIVCLISHACLAYAISIPGSISKRKAETNATLVAYGANSSAWPVTYGLDDGCLYIAENGAGNTTYDLAGLTWDLASITGENWIANATFFNGTSAGSLYIRPEANYALGVLPITRAAYVNGTVSGFALFASQLVYNNNTELESQFWAVSTNDTGVYQLAWNESGDLTDGSFPVVVKGVENS